jgi:hypothetical protein
MSGVHPKLVSALLGHSKVNLAMDVYDRADEQELRRDLLHSIARWEEAGRELVNCVVLGGPSRI